MVGFLSKKRTVFLFILFILIAVINISQLLFDGRISLRAVIIGLVLVFAIYLIKGIIYRLQKRNWDSRGRSLFSKTIEYLCIFIPILICVLFFTLNSIMIFEKSVGIISFNAKVYALLILAIVIVYSLVYAIAYSFRLSTIIQAAVWSFIIIILSYTNNCFDIWLLFDIVALIAVSVYCSLLTPVREKKYIYYSRNYGNGRRRYKGMAERGLAIIFAVILAVIAFFIIVNNGTGQSDGLIIKKISEFVNLFF